MGLDTPPFRKPGKKPPPNKSKRKNSGEATLEHSQKPDKMAKTLLNSEENPLIPASTVELMHIDSDPEGVISDLEPDATPEPQPTPPPESPIIRTRPNPAARVDLSQLTEIPADTRQVTITSLDPSISLTKFNPIKLAKAIDEITGKPVSKVEHLRSGSLMITCETLAQVKLFLSCKTFSDKNIPTKATIAWNKHFSYGKIYAPELKEETLQNILDYFRQSDVISVRKLFNDPLKQHIPLYVLTFLGKCPTNLKAGYSSFSVEKYYPSPLRCGKCCRWGHNAGNCRGNLTCSYCGKPGHKQSECKQSAPSCINCKQNHEASSHECSVFIREKKVCGLAVDLGIGFGEARVMINNNLTSPPFSSPVPIISSKQTFPHLESQTRPTPSPKPNHSHLQNANANSVPDPLTYNTNDSQWFSQQSTRSYYDNTSQFPSLTLPYLTPLSPLPPCPSTTDVSATAATPHPIDLASSSESNNSTALSDNNNNNSLSL